MHRTEGDGFVVDPVTGKNRFDPGDPIIPRPATLITADWVNAVQEELCNVVEELGGTVNTVATDTTPNQVVTALRSTFGRLEGGNTWMGDQAFDDGATFNGSTEINTLTGSLAFNPTTITRTGALKGQLLGVTSDGVLGFSKSIRESVNYVGATGQPAFQNGWSNGAGAVADRCRFVLAPGGIVHVAAGFASNGTLMTTAWNLPAGYRPEYTILLRGESTGGREFYLEIRPNGDVIPNYVNNVSASANTNAFRVSGSFIAA